MSLKEILDDCNVNEDLNEHLANNIEYTQEDITNIACNLISYHNPTIDEGYKRRIITPAIPHWIKNNPELEKTREVDGTAFYKRT